MDTLNSLQQYLSKTDIARAEELEKFIKNFCNAQGSQYTEEQLVNSELVPSILVGLFSSLKQMVNLGVKLSDFISVQKYAQLLSFSTSESIELTDKGFYTLNDVHMNRKGLLSGFSNKAKAYQLLYKVHSVTLSSLTAFNKLANTTITSTDYSKFIHFFDGTVLELIDQYIFDEQVKEGFIIEYCSNNYSVAKKTTVRQYLNFNFDLQKSWNLDQKRIQVDALYNSIAEVYFQIKTSKDISWNAQPVKGFLALKDNSIISVLDALQILTKGQFINIQVKQMFAGSPSINQLLIDKQEDLKKNLKRNIEANDDTIYSELYSCIMSGKIFDKTKDFNDIVTDLTILCSSGKAGGYLGTKAGSCKQQSLDIKNNGCLNFRLVYKKADDGSEKIVTGYEFFNKLADLACIKCLGQEQNNRQQRVVVNIKVLDRKIKAYLNSAKGKAVVMLLQSMRYRDFLAQQLMEKYFKKLPYDDNNASFRIKFETWLRQPQVLASFPNIINPDSKDFMFELMVALNAISLNKEVQGSCTIVNELINNAVVSDPLSEDGIQKHLSKPENTYLRDKISVIMWEFSQKAQKHINSEFQQTTPESLIKIMQNLNAINENLQKAMTIQTYVLIGQYLQNVYASNWGAILNTQASFYLTRFAFGGIIASIGIVIFFISCFKGGEWDWQRIVYTITGALSALSFISQVLSYILNSEWLFKASFVLSSICQVILGIVIIVLGILNIIEGVKLLDEGMNAKAIITITIGVLEVLAGIFMLLSIAFPGFAVAALALGGITTILYVVLYFLDDGVTTVLKHLKEQYPNLRCWQVEDYWLIFPNNLYIDNNEQPIHNAAFSYAELRRPQDSQMFKFVTKCEDSVMASARKQELGEDFEVISEIFPRMIKFKFKNDYKDLIDNKIFAHFNWVNISDGMFTYPCLTFGGIPPTSDPQLENLHEHSANSERVLTPECFVWLDQQTESKGYSFSWRWYQTSTEFLPLLTLE